MTPLRIVRLWERRPRRCRLGREDVDYLLRHHRRHIDVEPTERRAWYRLTPLGFVGVLHTPGCRLLIRPKLPLRTLAFLLDLPPEVLDATGEASRVETTLSDVLALRLARLMEERWAAGLYQDYRQEPRSGTVLRGKLDVVAQRRETIRGGVQLHMHTDIRSVDVPVNQTARFTADRLASWPGLSTESQTALKRALAEWQDVTPADPGEQGLQRLLSTPLPPGYGRLLECCRLILEGLGPGWTSGVAGPALLLNLERAFERLLTRGLIEAFAGGRHPVGMQSWHPARPQSADQPGLAFHPDIVLGPADRPLIVVDAKWKKLTPTALPLDDVQQVLAYALAIGARRAVLVYPTRRDQSWTYELPASAVRLEVCGLRVWGSAEQCQGALIRLGRRLRQQCDEIGA